VATFLLEIGTEGICQADFVALRPPGWQRAVWSRLALAGLRLDHGLVHGTREPPRRLAAISGCRAGGAPAAISKGSAGTACCPGFQRGRGHRGAAHRFLRAAVA